MPSSESSFRKIDLEGELEEHELTRWNRVADGIGEGEEGRNILDFFFPLVTKKWWSIISSVRTHM